MATIQEKNLFSKSLIESNPKKPKNYKISTDPNYEVNEKQSPLISLIEKINLVNLNEYYENQPNILFKKRIDKLNMKFFLESEKGFSNNSTIEEKEKCYNKLFLILFKQISVYIEEIERLNKALNYNSLKEKNNKDIVNNNDNISLKEKDNQNIIENLKYTNQKLSKKLKDKINEEERLKLEIESLKRQILLYKEKFKTELNIINSSINIKNNIIGSFCSTTNKIQNKSLFAKSLGSNNSTSYNNINNASNFQNSNTSNNMLPNKFLNIKKLNRNIQNININSSTTLMNSKNSLGKNKENCIKNNNKNFSNGIFEQKKKNDNSNSNNSNNNTLHIKTKFRISNSKELKNDDKRKDYHSNLKKFNNTSEFSINDDFCSITDFNKTFFNTTASSSNNNSNNINIDNKKFTQKLIEIFQNEYEDLCKFENFLIKQKSKILGFNSGNSIITSSLINKNYDEEIQDEKSNLSLNLTNSMNQNYNTPNPSNNNSNINKSYSYSKKIGSTIKINITNSKSPNKLNDKKGTKVASIKINLC